jgi:hypothetical protein
VTKSKTCCGNTGCKSDQHCCGNTTCCKVCNNTTNCPGTNS